MDAASEAAKLRFRPIIMTSLAFILGVVPLVIATGAGAAGRHSIGTGVFGGMLAATFLAIFFVPLFFVLIRKLSHRVTDRAVPARAPVAVPSEGNRALDNAEPHETSAPVATKGRSYRGEAE